MSERTQKTKWRGKRRNPIALTCHQIERVGAKLVVIGEVFAHGTRRNTAALTSPRRGVAPTGRDPSELV